MSTNRPQNDAQRDWARTPSAMFAAGVLGVASLGALSLAVSRDLQRQPQHPALQQPESASSQQLTNSVAREPRRASAVRLINVNSADLGELDLLPGIGPALGQRIIDYRSEHGHFASVDDLTRVSGIGPRTLDRLRPLVTLGDRVYTSDN